MLREKDAKSAQSIKSLQLKLQEMEEEKGNLEAELATQFETNANQVMPSLLDLVRSIAKYCPFF